MLKIKKGDIFSFVKFCELEKFNKNTSITVYVFKNRLTESIIKNFESEKKCCLKCYMLTVERFLSQEPYILKFIDDNYYIERIDDETRLLNFGISKNDEIIKIKDYLLFSIKKSEMGLYYNADIFTYHNHFDIFHLHSVKLKVICEKIENEKFQEIMESEFTLGEMCKALGEK